MTETFLNVRGADAVLDAVRSCWASMFSARTVFYRAKRGFGQADQDIAVVIQRQIASTRAGVMFTINPASADDSHLVIEGAFGLGESVVSGSVSPDRYLVDKRTLSILVREVHVKEVAIEPLADGGTVRRGLDDREALATVLDDEEVLLLARTGLTIERHYDTPQDTEWCFDADGALWMVQSRPITAVAGGDRFEPEAANPIVGCRGALRGARDPEMFGLELAALRRVWDSGHRNLHVMLRFVRTAAELRSCRALIAGAGLIDLPGFELWIMAEAPSVLFSLGAYAQIGIAGISICSGDLTRLLLGADPDSDLLAGTFDERDPAVTAYLSQLIPQARALGLQTASCGQAPSAFPESADLLVRAGIDAISVDLDDVDPSRQLIAAAEQRLLLESARAARPIQ